MDLILVFLVSFLLLIFSTLQGYFIAYPLLISMGFLVMVLIRRGFSFEALMTMAATGGKKSFSVISILILIGAVIATWLAAGTVPALIYYGMKWIHPQLFILSAFLLTSVVSLLIGTSFGTVGTIGLALMIAAQETAVNPHWIAGAIIAGAYFGDRCSPMSSSANLITILTQTQLYSNIQNMFKTGLIPLIMSCFIYGIASLFNPVEAQGTQIPGWIQAEFQISSLVLLPALMILGLAIFRVEVKISMVISLLTAAVIGMTIQHYSGWDILNFILGGFYLAETAPLHSIIQGGGMLSMLKISLVVVISTALAGIFTGTNILNQVEVLLDQAQSERHLFSGTIVIGTVAAAFGCTQTIAILLTQQLVQKKYATFPLTPAQLAVDLENTVVVISPLIPWNIAGFIPAAILTTDFRFIPYAVYLYLLPLMSWREKQRISVHDLR
ncbi:MAG: Na+/H+ antiporter NhaC family protein [Oscillatoriales cyanobacterium RM2_1_1]|nr:Na+/H+ antiporter NhaC family protein [Oscillatoriales cyanobacterium SM2_3_0]NJO47011.1 Na+/H+ antiporter NhaC family protein [Oscillatoriales cyanobacterium RM2_1_1]